MKTRIKGNRGPQKRQDSGEHLSSISPASSDSYYPHHPSSSKIGERGSKKVATGSANANGYKITTLLEPSERENHPTDLADAPASEAWRVESMSSLASYQPSQGFSDPLRRKKRLGKDLKASAQIQYHQNLLAVGVRMSRSCQCVTMLCDSANQCAMKSSFHNIASQACQCTLAGAVKSGDYASQTCQCPLRSANRRRNRHETWLTIARNIGLICQLLWGDSELRPAAKSTTNLNYSKKLMRKRKSGTLREKISKNSFITSYHGNGLMQCEPA